MVFRLVSTLLLAAATAAAASFGANVAQDGKKFCPTGQARAPEDVNRAVHAIKEVDFARDKFKVLNNFLQESSLSLYANQTAAIVDAFWFSDDRSQAVHLITPYIFSLACEDVVPFINKAGFSRDKLKILRDFAPLLVDSDVEAEAQKILHAFAFPDDIKKARKILDETPPISCTWGPITKKNVIFVVDISASMAETFQDSDGTTWNRLEYVLHELDEVVQEQLPKLEGRMFDVLTFDSIVTPWAPGLQPTTPENLASIKTWIDTRNIGSSTGTLNALQFAYGLDDVEAVYLLSDGMPNEAPSTILDAAKTLSKDGQIPCTTIFMGLPFQSEQQTASDFMEQLATVTGGSFRPITAIN